MHGPTPFPVSALPARLHQARASVFKLLAGTMRLKSGEGLPCRIRHRSYNRRIFSKSLATATYKLGMKI